MTPEGEGFLKYILLAQNGILRELEAVSPEALNWPLGVPETNTLYASAFHAASGTDYWVTVYVGGGAQPRNREAEFTTQGDLRSIQARWQQTADNAQTVLQRLAPADYEAMRQVRLGNTPQSFTVRECLLHVVEHVNLHVGHIQLARQLWEHQHKQ